MVNSLKEYFYTNIKLIDKLDIVSDNMCSDNGKKYIDFDNFPSFVDLPSIATADTLLLNTTDHYIVFVEFKNFQKVQDFKTWFSRARKQQLYLKAYESFLSLSQLTTKQYPFSYDDYFSLDKRFILVYDGRDGKQRIKRHIQGKINRFKFIFSDKVFVLRCERYKQFLEENDL